MPRCCRCSGSTSCPRIGCRSFTSSFLSSVFFFSRFIACLLMVSGVGFLVTMRVCIRFATSSVTSFGQFSLLSFFRISSGEPAFRSSSAKVRITFLILCFFLSFMTLGRLSRLLTAFISSFSPGNIYGSAPMDSKPFNTTFGSLAFVSAATNSA